MKDRLIQNAWVAYERCKAIENEWGKSYWLSVVNALTKKYSN